jgi:predicted alpha/beta hydrolase
MTVTRDLELRADDGYRLAATRAVGRGEQFVVVAGATAVPRRYYRRFAEYAAGRGVDVVTVDYRGVDGSRHGPLRGLAADLGDWCTRDLGAAVAWAAERGPTWVVGHSLGGHALGRLPEPDLVRAAYVCGTGAGWAGWMTPRERLRVRLLWDVVAPVTTAALGYLPMRALGMGEDLPLDVYRQWRHWCGFPRYFFDDPGAAEVTAPFARVTTPIAAAVATDDPWAPPRSRDAFFTGYPSAPIERIDLAPAELGVASVGHMGYFHADVGRVLWPRMLAWLSGHGLRLEDHGRAARADGTG